MKLSSAFEMLPAVTVMYVELSRSLVRFDIQILCSANIEEAILKNMAKSDLVFGSDDEDATSYIYSLSKQSTTRLLNPRFSQTGAEVSPSCVSVCICVSQPHLSSSPSVLAAASSLRSPSRYVRVRFCSVPCDPTVV
jgi:hypothetical protein